MPVSFIIKGERLHIAIEGDNRATRLYVNGKLVNDLGVTKILFNEGKTKMNYLRTLVFPLEQTGDFKSKITGLKVEKL